MTGIRDQGLVSRRRCARCRRATALWFACVRAAGGLSSAQAAGIAELAARHGNGLIDLTGRANLQIRGVSRGEPSRR